MGKIAIIGLGLMGGSMGLALRRARLKDTEVLGFDRNRDVAQRAAKAGAVDRVLGTVEGATEADLIIIATPITGVKKVLEAIAERIRPGTVVTDLASTKGDVIRWAEKLLPRGAFFVGGHPMAGKEQSGPQAAEATLFQGRPYCVIPSVQASPAAVNAVTGLAMTVGAEPFFLDADEHDAYAAAISHVPLVSSLALFNLARGSTAWTDLASMAGPGFRDLTRLASGDPEMAHDIFLTNKTNVVHWINRYIEELLKMRDLIEGDDSEALYRSIAETQIERETFLTSPPKRQPPGMDADLPSPTESLANLLVGSMWSQRAKEMTTAVEERTREREREERLRRRDEP